LRGDHPILRPSDTPGSQQGAIDLPRAGTPTRTVRGFVGDTIARPLIGARVEVLDGPQAGNAVTTDGVGWFTLAPLRTRTGYA